MTSFVFEPEAKLRGSRDYVHSTDLHEEIVAGATQAGLSFKGPVDFRIRAKITHRPRYLYQPVDQPVAVNAATCTFMSGSQAWVAVVTETDQFVTERKPYDEGPAAQFSTVEGLKASLNGPTQMRPIEALTALAVHLHKTALTPPSGQRWMLGQLSISRALEPDDAHMLTLDIDRQIGKTTTRTQITAHDGVIGTMIFILAAG